MKSRVIILLFTLLFLAGCSDNHFSTERIQGHAVIVDNYKDKNPLKGIYIEIVYTNDGGYTYNYLASTTTDSDGYFEFDVTNSTGYFNLDYKALATVYSDSDYSDSLGSFAFQFAEDTFKYKTIHLDTFSLSHNVILIPEIKGLGDSLPGDLSVRYSCELVDATMANMNFSGPFYENQTLEPVEMIMSMNYQHWLRYGSRDLAFVTAMTGSDTLGFGYFKLENPVYTTHGDTLYLAFDRIPDI